MPARKQTMRLHICQLSQCLSLVMMSLIMMITELMMMRQAQCSHHGADDDGTSPVQSAQTPETDYEYSVDDEEIDPSEVFPELATEAPTLETVTEAIPDVTENEVETQATLIEVLDEIFEDPSLPREEQHNVPRSPQFFVPTPIPAIPNQAALTFETHLDEDEHAFHNHFLSSVEGEASLVGKMFRDEQDIQEQEALHHHEDHEEGHGHQVAENEIPTSVAPRPGSEHKGRRVLKKRPIRIKIPAGLRQNLQVIPESLTQDVSIQDDDIIIATPITAAPALSFQEPEATPQLQVRLLPSRSRSLRPLLSFKFSIPTS